MLKISKIFLYFIRFYFQNLCDSPLVIFMIFYAKSSISCVIIIIIIVAILNKFHHLPSIHFYISLYNITLISYSIVYFLQIPQLFFTFHTYIFKVVL